MLPITETEVKYARVPLPTSNKYKTPLDYPTVPQIWEETRKKFHQKNALNWTETITINASSTPPETKKEQKTMTWGEYYESVRRTAKAFIHLGLEPKKVCIFGKIKNSKLIFLTFFYIFIAHSR